VVMLAWGVSFDKWRDVNMDILKAPEVIFIVGTVLTWC
jgi:hypothetical protein